MTDFRVKLRGFRRANGMTQGELGAELGVPQTTISKWENGQQRPSAEHAEKLSQRIGIPVVELLDLEIQAGPEAEQNRGFAEMKQAGFDEAPPGTSAVDSGKSKKPARHPAWGVWKGLVTLDPNYDYTQPADPDWGKVYDQ